MGRSSMSHGDTTPFQAISSRASSAIEQLAPEICRILAGPKGEGVHAPLRELLVRFTDAFGADDACLCYQRHGVTAPPHLATSDGAHRLAGALLDGRWFPRQLGEGTPLVLRRGAIDMPDEADHERQCIRAA